MLVLVCYDVVKTKKRTQMVKILESYGTRVQFSVFECDVEKKQMNDLHAKLKKIMVESPEEGDSVRFYKLCEKCVGQIKILGHGQVEVLESFMIF